MLYLAVIGVNCAYILAELIFNVQLISVTSSESNMDQINNIELFGRTLSSLGFSLLVIKLYSSFLDSKFTESLRYILNCILILVVTFPIFYASQKAFIDYMAEQTTTAQQQAYYNTFVVKKAMLSPSEGQSMNFFDNSESVERKVFLSTLGPLDGYSGIIDEIKERNDVTEISSERDSVYLGRKLFNNYQSFVYNNTDLYSQYEKAQDNYREKIREVDDEAEEVYEALVSYERRRQFYMEYLKTTSKIRKGRKFVNQSLYNKVADAAWNLGYCGDQKCVERKINNYEKTQVKIAQSHLGKHADQIPTYSFYEVCSFENNGGNSGRSVFHYVVGSGETKTREVSNNLDSIPNYQNRLVCHFNLETMRRNYLSVFNRVVKEEYGIYDEDIESTEAFSNSAQFANAIEQYAERQNRDVDLPRNWNYKDKDAFVKALVGKQKEQVEKNYQDEIQKKIGSTISLKLSKEQFMGADFLKEIINQRYQKEFGLKVDSNDFSNFYNANKSKLQKISKESIKNFDFEDKGADIVKAMIIPPVAMFLSLLFLLLNSLGFILDLVKKLGVPDFINKVIFFVAPVMIGALPFFVPVDSGQKLLNNDLANNSVIMSEIYNWVVGMEVVLYSIGEPINEVVVPIVSKMF